ncbi:MAG: hypothetical protein AAF442_07485 [Pseudomonadota bacterium]
MDKQIEEMYDEACDTYEDQEKLPEILSSLHAHEQQQKVETIQRAGMQNYDHSGQNNAAVIGLNR